MKPDGIPQKDNEKISVEYCHIDPYGNYKKAIAEANYWMPRVIEAFKGQETQLGIMIDDVHTNFDIDDQFINKVLDLLEIKPDVIYLESSFMNDGKKMLSHLMEHGQDERSVDDIELVVNLQQKRMWIRENVKGYKQQTEFMVSYDREKNGEEAPSCPSLAAAAYLCRLGKRFSEESLTPIWGEELIEADRAVNILSSYYLQVEDKAQAIIQAIDVDYLRRISWFLY